MYRKCLRFVSSVIYCFSVEQTMKAASNDFLWLWEYSPMCWLLSIQELRLPFSSFLYTSLKESRSSALIVCKVSMPLLLSSVKVTTQPARSFIIIIIIRCYLPFILILPLIKRDGPLFSLFSMIYLCFHVNQDIIVLCWRFERRQVVDSCETRVVLQKLRNKFLGQEAVLSGSFNFGNRSNSWGN